jgi:hypothetical protein
MFAASAECLLNNLLSRICLLRFFKHNEVQMSKKSRPQAYKSCWRVLRQSGGAQLEMGLASSLAVARGFREMLMDFGRSRRNVETVDENPWNRISQIPQVFHLFFANHHKIPQNFKNAYFSFKNDSKGTKYKNLQSEH